MINEHIDKLRKIVPALNKTVDEVDKVIIEIETILGNDLNLGISTEYSNDHGDVALCYQRISGIFRFAVKIDGNTTLWHQCCRADKLIAFQILPEVLKNLVDDAETEQMDVDGVLLTMKEILGK